MKEITAEELKKALEEGTEKIFVVDVRETDEVADKPLLPAGTKQYANLPLSILQMLPKDELKSRLEGLAEAAGVKLDDTRLILSCRSGGRSSMAQQLLAIHGIASENLVGGYLGWQG